MTRTVISVGSAKREGRDEEGEARGERKRGEEKGSHEESPAKCDGFGALRVRARAVIFQIFRVAGEAP